MSLPELWWYCEHGGFSARYAQFVEAWALEAQMSKAKDKR